MPLSVSSPTAAADVAAHCKVLVAEADAALQQLAACRLGSVGSVLLPGSAGALQPSFEAAAAGSPLRSLLAGNSTRLTVTVSPSNATREATAAAGLRALDRDIAQAEASLSAAAARLSQPGGGLRGGH